MFCVGINPRCIDAGTIDSVTVQKYDGTNWEKSMDEELKKDGGGIKQFSKE